MADLPRARSTGLGVALRLFVRYLYVYVTGSHRSATNELEPILLHRLANTQRVLPSLNLLSSPTGRASGLSVNHTQQLPVSSNWRKLVSRAAQTTTHDQRNDVSCCPCHHLSYCMYIGSLLWIRRSAAGSLSTNVVINMCVRGRLPATTCVSEQLHPFAFVRLNIIPRYYHSTTLMVSYIMCCSRRWPDDAVGRDKSPEFVPGTRC
jgi:hypothetical protein